MSDTDSGDDLLRAVAAAPHVTPPEMERDARLGTTIRDKYTLERVLGEGGMAIVYEGTHRNNKRFAIKVLREKFSDSEIRARFAREGYVANSVGHPGAVAILDDDIAEDGSPFLVMELLDGAPLDHLVARGAISLRAALAIGTRVLDVLGAAHVKGIVHRDVKPQNVFVTRTGDVKVLDFGIARMRSPSASAAFDTTQAGAMLGTPAFMAPEQALGRVKEIDAQSDVWAVGATMFVMLTGRPVHQGESAQEVAALAATQRAPRIHSVKSRIPSDVARVVDRALAFDKAARWADAASMRRALFDAFTKHFVAEPSASDVVSVFDASHAPPIEHKRTFRVAALGVGFALACGAAVVWASSERPTPRVATVSIAPTIVASAPMSAATSPPPPVEAVVQSARPSDAPTTRRESSPMPTQPVVHVKNCNPPFTVDDTGKRIPKPECL